MTSESLKHEEDRCRQAAGIYVTEANLNFHRSITLDPEHCEEAEILPMEFVEIWNKNSGARISTYVILGERGSRSCIPNGAAAGTCQLSDQVNICNSASIEEAKLTSLRPNVLTVDEGNFVRYRLSYSVSMDSDGRCAFNICNHSDDALPIPALVSDR